MLNKNKNKKYYLQLLQRKLNLWHTLKTQRSSSEIYKMMIKEISELK